MGQMQHRKAVIVGAVLLLALAGYASGQSTFNSLASFTGSSGAAPGDGPRAGMTLSSSTLYGTTQTGGTNGYGEVFSIPTSGGTPTVLASFTGNTGSAVGSEPLADLTLSGSTLYGTTYAGGANGYGEVFSIPTSGGSPTVLTSFTASTGSAPGLAPEAGLTLSGSTLYGTTFSGGGNGEVFSISTSGGSPTVLASFTGNSGAAPGDGPVAGLTISGGTLYGTTYFGGANGDGEVFSIPTSGGSPTVLASFTGNTGSAPGANPRAGLTLSGSTLYGTTEYGGANGDGEVFSIATTGGTPNVLASFTGNTGSAPGENPAAGLTLSGSTLYGTTEEGGANDDGEVFSIPTSGGTPTVLVSFTGSTGDAPGAAPEADLTLSDNTLYGTTSYGGANNDGTVFSITVPEPGSASLLAVAGFGLMRRCRRKI